MDSPVSSSWPSRLEWGLIVAFWATYAVLSIGQGVLDDGRGGIRLGRALIEVTEYGAWIVLTPIVFRLAAALPVVEAVPSEWLTALRNVTLHVAAALLISISIDLSEDLVAVTFASPGPSAGVFQQIYRLWFLDELMIYVLVLMVGFARSYYLEKKAQQEQAERLEERAQSLEAQLTEARLEALRMQLNPHFLFNTLHAVSTLVDRDPDGVRRMIARLSELLRNVLDEEAPQEVPLSEELEFLEDYLEIQSIRFQGELDAEIGVPTELRDAQVPNLVLQPVVENAIKHGASQVRGVGRIELRGRREGDDLVLSVRDNGPGLPESQEDGLGLRNVRARLRELYGEDQSLRLEAAPNGGTIAILKLPYHTSASLYTAAGTASLTDAAEGREH